MVITGAPVSVLIDHGLEEAIVERLVGAGIGTVERLGSMTPEELEAIPDIDEAVVSQIQSSVVAFYGQYESEEGEQAPVDAEGIESAIDSSDSEAKGPADLEIERDTFENIETGVLEQDLATHQAALLEESEEGEILDLGRVEGLSAAPSALGHLAGSEENADIGESDTIKNTQ
ncbi:MAG: helix-hairpin-helix domain-containing protein [Acidobacteriia bacterium]|nr:helix-hairpin-helix domain-containing protein [Terriglobia bacterium]